MPNDNRMGWIRNLEALAGEVPTYTVEYELGSECSLTGLLDYGDGRIICAPMGTEKSRDGMWLYNLVVSFPLGAQDESPEARLRKLSEAEAKGYYFKDGILGELLALLSFLHRCRFFLISSRLPPGNPRTGMTIKTEYPYIRVACDPGIHPPVFQSADKNLAVRFAEFLNELKTLDEERHQDFVLACYHYRRAINEIGVDPEMVFIRLVSAIETLARDTKLTSEEDCLEDKGIAELIAQSNLSPGLKGELKNTFDVRKARKKFIRFMEQHSGGFFEKGDAQQSQLKIKDADLERVLDTIYRARSRYLHSGEPMYLSRPMRGGENWDTDPSLGMIADNRHIPGSEKLPYSYFFEGLVRHCLLNYLKKHTGAKAMSELVFAFGSNMSSARFRDYKVSPEGAGSAAVLEGHRLVFNKASKDGSGKASVEPQEGSYVWGVLYKIPSDALSVLDNGEGRGYRRVQLPVRIAGTDVAQAWVYLAAKPSTDPELRPYAWYTNFLVEGAREHALPPDYITELERIEAVADPNKKRDAEKRALLTSS